jgi:hypothetical protein
MNEPLRYSISNGTDVDCVSLLSCFFLLIFYLKYWGIF